MKQIQISTIIPIYNSEKLISRTLDSIINQKYRPMEIILVNDCSTDNTKNICFEYIKKYNFIKMINLSENKGVSNARNKGIEVAKGDYIHFMDSDDTINDHMYLELSKYMEKGYYDIVTTGSSMIFNNNNIEKRHIKQDIICKNKTDVADYLKRFTMTDKERVLNVIWNKLYSRKIINKYNLKFDMSINLGEDFLFNCLYLKKVESLLEIKSCMYNYYKNQENNLTSKFRVDILSRRKKVYNAWIDLYKSYNIYDDKKKKEFENYEGFLMYYSLYTVFSKTCKLNEEEKINFLHTLIMDDHIKFVYRYLRIGIEKYFINSKNVNNLYKYMKLKYYIKTKLKLLKEKIIKK